MTLAVVPFLVLATVSGAGAGAVPGPLSTAPPPGGPVSEAPARALPRVATVCRAAGEPRCWVRSGEATCAPDGEPYRVVPDRPAEVAAALAACRAPVEPVPAPATP